MRQQSFRPFSFGRPFDGYPPMAWGWRERREYRRAMRRQYGYRFNPFAPLIGMFWMVFGLAFAFSPDFRYTMIEVFRTIVDAFRTLFTGY